SGLHQVEFNNNFDNVIHEILDKKIKGEVRFNSSEDIVIFSKNYLLNEREALNNNYLKPKNYIRNYIEILNKIKKLKFENPCLYDLLIQNTPEPSLRSRLNVVSNTYIPRHNIVSKQYLQDYTN
ncbi:hypothetical protein ACFO4M_31935, partial [Pseudonocardia nematodicida]|uniref:hypothetical protein n=1 Tax=Pseudonocardia nematodicida TaxID=1206997 RepID=UPI00361D17E3